MVKGLRLVLLLACFASAQDWVQRTVSRTYLGTGPSRWFKAYSSLISDDQGRVWNYNGVHDNRLDPNDIIIYDNALFQISLSGSTNANEDERAHSNWTVVDGSNNRPTQLAADTVTPTLMDRHTVKAYNPLDSCIYFVAGLSTNHLVTRTFTDAQINDAGDYVDMAQNITPMHTGTIVRVSTSGVLPTGLAASTNYWIIRNSSTRIQFATSYANAKAGTDLSIVADGSGTHTITVQTNTGNGNHPSDTWRMRVGSGTGTGGSQYAYQQLFPDFSYYHTPGQIAFNPSMAWYPPGSYFVITNVNTDGFTSGNRTTFLYKPSDNTYTRLSSQTVNLGGPDPGSANTMCYETATQRIYLFGSGGTTGGNDLRYYRGSDSTWVTVTEGNTPPAARVNHGVACGAGKVWMQGGETSGGADLRDTWVYDPATNLWDSLEVTLPTASSHTYMTYDGDHLVMTQDDLQIWTMDIAEASASPAFRKGLLGVGK
jgi:hypothetical protein